MKTVFALLLASLVASAAAFTGTPLQLTRSSPAEVRSSARSTLVMRETSGEGGPLRALRVITQPIGNAVSMAFSIPNKIIFHSFIKSDLPKNYQERSAKEKLDILWEKCIADTKGSGHTPNLEAIPVFFRNMNEMFDHIADERPWRGKKPIHGEGYVCKGKFTAAQGSPYTGIFKGCDNVLMRSAPGLAPKQGMLLAGISLKFMIDGLPSTNYLSLRKFGTNTNDLNWFDSIKSHLGSEITGPIGPPLAMKFRTANTKFGSFVGICDIADTDQKGRKAANPKFPYEMYLEGTSAMDGRLYEELEDIKAGTKMYNVYAKELNDDSPKKLIGSLTTTSHMTKSWYADRKLFFQHIRRDDDVKKLLKCPVAH